MCIRDSVYQLIGSVEPDIKVIRNDEYTVEEIETMKPEALILSPGPGKPADAGVDVYKRQGLGDCLPACPTGAITFVEREAAAYDEAAVIRNQRSLQQWPVQIKLVPTSAPYFDGAKLLIAADCTAYAYASFHEDFKNEKIVLVGCPKLDSVDYSEKLEEIIRSNNITEVTIVRMEVPCCGGLEMAAKRALQNSGK